jgi:ATP-binding cassette subfamily B protein
MCSRFAALWLAGEVVWRIAAPSIARAEIRGIESLYIEAMMNCWRMDLAFFQNNFAGSLTKRALGYAVVLKTSSMCSVSRSYRICCRCYSSPSCCGAIRRCLIVVLLGMLIITCMLVAPRFVDAPSGRYPRSRVEVLAGHLADSIANAKPFAPLRAESDEARIHTRNVNDFGAKTCVHGITRI